MKRKLLTLGSFVATAIPISAVIACSPSSSMGEKESKFLAAFKSNDGLRLVNNKWLNKALENIEIYKQSKNGVATDYNKIRSDLKSYIKFFINEELRKDNDYLRKLKGEWDGLIKDRTLKAKMETKYLMLDSYISTKDWEDKIGKTTNTASIDDFINDFLFNKDNYKLEKDDFLFDKDKYKLEKKSSKYDISKKTDFLVNIKKALITKAYLAVKKDDWMKVFGDEKKDKLYDQSLKSNPDVWSAIKEENFPLVIEGMKKHYAYSWHISISDKDNFNQYRELGEKPVSTIKGYMKQGGDLAKIANREEIKKQIVKDYVSFPASSDDDYIGYNGVVSLPSGSGIINFDWNNIENFKKRKITTDLSGFIKNNKLITGNDNMEVVEPSSSPVIDLTLYQAKGLTPRYDSTHKKISFEHIKGKNRETLNWILINKNANLYTKAMQYFINKQNPIQLEVKDNYLKKILVDAGIKFVK